MALDYFIDIGAIKIGIPNAFGVDHNARALLTAIKAAGIVKANPASAGQAQFLDPFFHVIAGFGGVLGGAASTGRAVRVGLTLIGTDKNMVAEITHRLIFKISSKLSGGILA